MLPLFSIPKVFHLASVVPMMRWGRGKCITDLSAIVRGKRLDRADIPRPLECRTAKSSLGCIVHAIFTLIDSRVRCFWSRAEKDRIKRPLRSMRGTQRSSRWARAIPCLWLGLSNRNLACCDLERERDLFRFSPVLDRVLCLPTCQNAGIYD